MNINITRKSQFLESEMQSQWFHQKLVVFTGETLGITSFRNLHIEWRILKVALMTTNIMGLGTGLT